MTEAEFKARMAQDGVVVLQPKDYDAFDIPDTPVRDRKLGLCSSPPSPGFNYSLCRETTTQTIDNVDFFRVTFDAFLSGPCVEPNNKCPSLSIVSSTVRGDGVILQDEEIGFGLLSAETDFVALYPAADDFTFNHTSIFQPVNDTLTATLNP